VLTFWGMGKVVVVFQPIPTLLSGLTVKRSESLGDVTDGTIAPCPGKLSMENRDRSRRPPVRYRTLTCPREAKY